MGLPPHFDSPAIFCRLLDAERGGYFQIAPVDSSIPGAQRYLRGSNILQTTFTGPTGEAEAKHLFERVLTCAGPLGLFSEEIAAGGNIALGNYPQALTHIALINSALNLQRAELRDTGTCQCTLAG